MSWTHGLRRVSELAWEALSTGRCAWESVGDVQLDRRGHVEHVWALGQRRPEENRKSKAACVMSSCGAVAFDLTRLRTYLGDMHELQKVGPYDPVRCGELARAAVRE